MRRIVIWLASTVTVVVLLFGYHTSTDQTSTAGPRSSVGVTPAPAGGSSTSGSPPHPSRSPASGGASTSSGSSSGGSTAPRTYTGSVAQTRWGPVQVEISVADHKVTDVTVVQEPNGNQRDAEINDSALPILVQETMSAQSANIDMVSGATVTSDGYVRSLQGALDEARI